MKRKKNRAVKIIVAIVIVLGAVAGGLLFMRQKFAAPSIEGITYTVTRETYENAIEISGTVLAAQEQKLQALSSGTVVNVYVVQGDTVKKGDTIMQLDDTEQVYNLAKHDYDMATTRIVGAARELQLKETQRLSLLRKIEDRKVVATFDGIIAEIDVKVGDSLEAKDKVGTIVDVSYLTADVEVPETDVAQLKIGQKALLTFPAHDGVVEGYVMSWPAIGTVTSRGTTVVKVKIRIDDYPESILPYYSFSGKIEVSPPENFLLVSRLAVGRDDKGAFVEDAKTGEKKYVKVSRYGAENMRIDSDNIKEGDVLKAQSAARASGTNTPRPGAMPPGMPGGARPGGR